MQSHEAHGRRTPRPNSPVTCQSGGPQGSHMGQAWDDFIPLGKHNVSVWVFLHARVCGRLDICLSAWTFFFSSLTWISVTDSLNLSMSYFCILLCLC